MNAYVLIICNFSMPLRKQISGALKIDVLKKRVKKLLFIPKKIKMEPKKIKKLVINQEVISNLNEQKMSRLKGGDSDICTYYFWTCLGGNCPNTTTIIPGSVTCPPKTDILPGGDCHTQDQEICRDSNLCINY